MQHRSEFKFIQQLAATSQHAHPLVKLGIGDDAAILGGIKDDQELVVTTDALMEGVDFLTAECGYYLAGRKALAVNLSDLAAMAALPVAAFVSLVLPKSMSAGELDDLMRGILELAQEFKFSIAGGDTNSWDGQLVISITALGVCKNGKSVKRNGAKPGELIFVSGQLGGSITGRHLTFTPRIKLAQQLIEQLQITSMLDISDGLSGDLQHILQASGVGAIVDLEKLPLSPAAKSMGDQLIPTEHALHDGEDFELLFTMNPNQQEMLSNLITEVPITMIGEITRNSGYLMRDQQGQLKPVPLNSWTHPIGH